MVTAGQLSLGDVPPTVRGPRGASVGDVIVAEGTRWRVRALDPVRREAVCELLRGSHCLRRFRARQILGVERIQ